MLPTFWRTQYQLLLEKFQAWQSLLNSGAIRFNEVKNGFDQLKKHFYNQIVPLKADDVDLRDMARWQSLQTELYRTMRLVETDMLFLQSSRQTATRQSRLKQISDRLPTMMRFCQEILKIE
jgi:hypothetical protein